MSSRISLGVAFLSKALSASSSAKCILHAEYIIKTQKYVLTRITYAHNRSAAMNVKSFEITCTDLADVLKRLARSVQRKINDGFSFDVNAMQIMEEEDETWDDFEVNASAVNDEDEADLQHNEIITALLEQSHENKARQPKRLPSVASRIRQGLEHKVYSQRLRYGH